jgi:hypothetical protein
MEPTTFPITTPRISCTIRHRFFGIGYRMFRRQIRECQQKCVMGFAKRFKEFGGWRRFICQS